MAGETMLGLSTGHMNVLGLGVFGVFIAAALWLLMAILANMRGNITNERDVRRGMAAGARE